MEALEDNSVLLKCAPSPAFFSQYQAIVLFGLAMRAFTMSSSRSSIHVFSEFRSARTVM
jgi:hypothetical protein